MRQCTPTLYVTHQFDIDHSRTSMGKGIEYSLVNDWLHCVRIQQNKYFARSEGLTAASVCLSVWASSPYQIWLSVFVCCVKTDYLTDRVLLEKLSFAVGQNILRILWNSSFTTAK